MCRQNRKTFTRERSGPLSRTRVHIFKHSQQQNQTCLSMQDDRHNKKMNMPNAGCDIFNCKKHFTSVFCQDHPGHHPTNKFALNKIYKKKMEFEKKIAPFSGLKHVSLFSPARVHGGPRGDRAHRHAYVWPHCRCVHSRVNDVLHLSATEHGTADKHQVGSAYAVHTNGKHFVFKIIERVHVCHVTFTRDSHKLSAPVLVSTLLFWQPCPSLLQWWPRR